MAVPDLSGCMLGAYAVQQLLGDAGVVRTYRGVDVQLQRPAAIKALAATTTSPELVDRFRQEARLLARLHHPHIVQIYDVGEQDGILYMVQELLPAPTLEQRLAKLAAHGFRLDQQEIVAIVSQLASALDAVHAAGIIHRNVKPGSVMWNAAGALKLALRHFG